MKVGDFIVHNSYEHSDDHFSVIKEITDTYVVFDSFEGSKNKGKTQAPISHLNNYRPSNSEELIHQKEYLNKDVDTFKTGGEVKKINYTWDKLPITFKVDESPNLRKINFNPKDDGLRLLFQNIVSKNELRPNMSGVFFDEEGVVSTDAHKLVYIPYGKEKPSYQGIFNMHDKKSKYTGVSLGKKIDAKYPNYKAVIPMDNKDYVTVDLAKLRIYANALTEGFANKTTKQIHTLIGESVFGFNGEFLIQCIDVLMSLGHEYSDVYYSSPNRACVLVPKGGRMMKDLTVLIMPVFFQEISVDVKNVNNSGAEDIDFQYEFLGLYSFNENKILFRDKKYEIEKGISKKEAWGKYDISLEDFKEFKRIGTKNKRMYIEDFCLLKNGQLHQSDINDSVYLIVDGVKLEGDGFYRYTDLGLLYDNSQNEKQDDYPLPYKTEENLEEFGVVEISDVEYFKENMKYASKVAMRDDLRPTVSQIFFETVENNLRIKSTDAHNIFSNRIDCMSDKNIQFILSSSINTSIFNILDEGFVIKIYTLEKNESTPFSDDLKIIEFKTLNKNIIIRSSNNRDNKILNNLNQFLQGDNVGLYTHELSINKNKLKEIFSDFNKDRSMGSSVQIIDVGKKFTISKGEFNFDVNVKKIDIFTTKNGLFVMNPCSDGRICISSTNIDNLSKLLEKSEVRFIFDEKAKLNYLDSLNFEFDKKGGEKTTSPKSDTTKKAVKKTEPSVNKTETSNDKIIRFEAEIDGYNDLIELAEDDVLGGANKIKAYKEMIEGLEMLIELEKDSNPNYETPIAVYKEVDSEKDRIKFIDYVLGFYGADGIYAKDYKGGFSREQVEKAVEQYLNDPETNWGDGDSADREIMRDKYLVPMLDSMEDVVEENEQEEKDMIQQKLLNKEWDIADDYNRNYMDKYGFYGSDKFLKNFPIIEDVLIKSDERIGKMFNAEDGKHEIIGKELHPTGNSYEIKKLNTNAIYSIREDGIDEWIDRMERTTTKEYKDEKEFEDKINFLKNDDNFTNDALDYILSEIPMGVIEEVYIQDSSRSGVKNLLKEFLKKNNIEVPDNKMGYLNHLVDGLKAKYYLRNKQEIIDVLGDKATPSVMNVLWGKKYKYTFDKNQLILNRKQFIDLKLKDGYVVEGERPDRKLRNPSQNSYYSERDLTRAEFDYAEAKFKKK